MRNSLVFTILLITSSIIELSIVNTFIYPLFLFPLTFAIGILLFHTLPIFYGVVWICLTPIVFSILGSENINLTPYLITAVISTFLMIRIFTRRSIYALLGLGFITINTLSIFQLLLRNFNFHNASMIKTLIYTNIELFIALTIGFVVIQKLKPLGSLFIISKK